HSDGEDDDKQPCRHTRADIKTLKWADYKIIQVRDAPGKDNVLDVADHKAYRGHALGHLIPKSKLVQLHARLAVDPKTKDILLLVRKTTPQEDEISEFKLTSGDKLAFEKHYGANPNLFKEIDSFFIPRLVGQTLRKQLMYLVLHSPPWIDLPDGTRMRGLLRFCQAGDTKTFKTSSSLWIAQNLRI